MINDGRRPVCEQSFDNFCEFCLYSIDSVGCQKQLLSSQRCQITEQLNMPDLRG